MKITNTIAPLAPFSVTGNTTTFYANLAETVETDGSTGEAVTLWTYEQYELPVQYTANLEAQIAENYDVWLQKAKDFELAQEAQKVREYRDKLLNECDLIYCNAANWAAMSKEKRAQWQKYKQDLRDVTKQEGFPYHVVFPVKPD